MVPWVAVSHLGTDVLGGLLLCGPILCTVDCWAAFLASTYQMPVVHPLSCDSQKCLRCQMSPEGQNHPRLKNHWFKAFQFRPLRLLWSKSEHLTDSRNQIGCVFLYGITRLWLIPLRIQQWQFFAVHYAKHQEIPQHKR